MIMMNCQNCDKLLPKSQPHRGGQRKFCSLECVQAKRKIYARKYNLTYWKNHPESAQKAVKRKQQARLKRRAQIIQRLGRRCVKCGFSDVRALQFDHVNGGGKSEWKRLGRDGLMQKLLTISDSDLFTHYQLLCANCNWIKRAEKGEFGKHTAIGGP